MSQKVMSKAVESRESSSLKMSKVSAPRDSVQVIHNSLTFPRVASQQVVSPFIEEDLKLEETIKKLDNIIQRQFKDIERRLPQQSQENFLFSNSNRIQSSSVSDLLPFKNQLRENDEDVRISTTNKKGVRNVHVELDVSGFNAEDIHIRTNGNVLKVFASHSKVKDEKQTSSVRRTESASSLSREVLLPDEVRSQNLKCWINDYGWLVVEGPLGRDIQPTKQDRKVTFQL